MSRDIKWIGSKVIGSVPKTPPRNIPCISRWNNPLILSIDPKLPTLTSYWSQHRNVSSETPQSKVHPCHLHRRGTEWCPQMDMLLGKDKLNQGTTKNCGYPSRTLNVWYIYLHENHTNSPNGYSKHTIHRVSWNGIGIHGSSPTRLDWDHGTYPWHWHPWHLATYIPWYWLIKNWTSHKEAIIIS